jgi:enoyl-CoA hydratase
MAYDNLIVTEENGLGWIFVNRPDKLNALNRKTIDELKAAFRAFRENAGTAAVILTGSGEKAFIAGADISELTDLDADTGRRHGLHGQELTLEIEDFPKPVIAAVNGYALGGGCEMAMACHVRIAADNAKLGQPEAKLGLIPGYGGTQRLSRLVGKGPALELILTGRVIDAQEALRIGLVNRVVPQAELHSACESLAHEMKANGPLAHEYTIAAVNRGLNLTLEEGLRLEAEYFGVTCGSQDGKEGTRAFLEKRRPRFHGK